MRYRSPRLSYAIILAALVALHCATSIGAQPTEFQFDIKSQPLGSALQEFAKQSGVQIVFFSKIADALKAPAVQGRLSVDAALQRLLEYSKLRYRRLNEKTIEIRPLSPGSSNPATGGNPEKIPSRGSTSADQSSVYEAAVNDTQKKYQNSGRLQEVLVTAEKRQENQQNVPMSITVLNPSNLIATNELRLQDYVASVPGLSFTTTGFGNQWLSIRGLITGTNNAPTVGILVDGVPFGASSLLGSGAFFPDFDPSDLQRIEVLKGPQGTLYGANSLGGLISYVTKDPSMKAWSGGVEASANTVDHGAGGYGLRADENMPITDSLAIRVSGFSRRDPGFVDNITSGISNVNSTNVYGGHAAALWRFSPRASLKISALLQDTHAYGSPWVASNVNGQPALGEYQQYGLPGTGVYTARIQFYTAQFDANMDGLTFVSQSSYGNTDLRQIKDLSSYAPYTEPYTGASGVSQVNDFSTRKVTQEFRLLSPEADKIAWLLGVFYTNEHSPVHQLIVANNGSTGQPVVTGQDAYEPYDLTEYAAYGDVTFHVTRKLSVQVGGRESDDRQVYRTTATGPLVPLFEGVASPDILPTGYESSNSVSYLFTTRYKISTGVMAYARVASGFRIGGPNEAVPAPLPRSFAPDKTINYELGIKGDFLDHRISTDASIYYIDWRNIQLSLEDLATNEGYQANGGTAKSDGVELSIALRPTDRVTLRVVGSADDAVLTETLPANSTAYGLSGDRLPYSSKYSGTVSVDYDALDFSKGAEFLGASFSYIGSRLGGFQSSANLPRSEMPGYSTVNLHASTALGSWTLDLFANNVANSRGLLSVSTFFGAAGGYVATVTQPRTFGVSISTRF